MIRPTAMKADATWVTPVQTPPGSHHVSASGHQSGDGGLMIQSTPLAATPSTSRVHPRTSRTMRLAAPVMGRTYPGGPEVSQQPKGRVTVKFAMSQHQDPVWTSPGHLLPFCITRVGACRLMSTQPRRNPHFGRSQGALDEPVR